MRIVVSGGSNAIIRDGWFTELGLRLPAATLRNVSVGAATSTMGLYRTLTAADLRQGDVLVWEYGLNDQHHIDMKGNDKDTLLRHCDMALRHAEEAGARPLGIALAPVHHALDGSAVTEYATKLTEVFASRGVPLYRVWSDVAARTGTALSQEDFRDPLHLAPGGRAVKDIAAWLAEEVGRAGRNERHAAGLRAGDSRRIHVVQRFEGGEPGRFTNALIDVAVWSVPDRPGALRWTNDLGERFEVHGVVILAEAGSGALKLTLGPEEVLLSTAPRVTNGVGTLFRFFCLQAATGRRFHLSPGEHLAMEWHAGRQRGIAFDVGFMPRPKPAKGSMRSSRIAAVLLESGGS